MSGLTPDSPYLGLVSNIQLRPVFVLGLNRSGTSLLYHLLHQAGCFNVVAAFDLVHRDRLLYLHLHPDELESCRLRLRNWFQKRNLKDRGYDRIPVGSDLPEEYGYALDDFSLTPRLTRRNIEQFRTFARKVQFVGKPEQPLLLKNPWDTNNFLEIRRMFPQARFLFIHRHPIPVLSSQLKMFGGLLRRPSEYDMLIEESYRRFCESRVLRSIIRAIFSDSLPILFWRLYRNVVRCCDYMTENVPKLGDVGMGITYDQLCRDPNGSISGILRFLGMDASLQADCAPRIQARAQPLHPTVARMRKTIEKRTQVYCRTFSL